MNPIVFPLEPKTKSPAVADLHDALLLLIERQAIKTFLPPNRPTPKELRMLARLLEQEQGRREYGDATRQLVLFFQSQQNLGDTLDGVVEAKTAAVLNEVLRDLGAFSTSPTFTVSGRVYSAESAGVGGLRVQVVDKNAGPDVPLAEGATDERGQYALSYSIAKVVTLGKSEPDIQVRISSGRTFLGASEVRYDAAPSETLDVLLPATASGALLSEHAVLTGAIATHYTGKLKDLRESDERSDITYLANKTGWDARAVALVALADEFSATSAPSIPPEFFYALFRAGLPANEDILYAADAKVVEAIWTQAAEEGVIPESLAQTIPEAVREFESVSAQRLLTNRALVGMLTSSGLTDAAQQKQFAALSTAHRTDVPAFWKAIDEQLGPVMGARLQLDGKLAFLTLSNAPLMQALHGTGGGRGLSDPLQLAEAGLHRPGRWRELLTAGTPIPPEIPGDTAEARQANYAEFLAARVRLSYPTAAVAEMVKSGDLPVSAPQNVHDFLAGQQGKFKIAAQPVEQFIAQNNLQVAPETVTEIKRLQRVYQITPSDQAMTGLLKQGIDAAYHVVRFDKEAFIQRFAQDLGSADHAALVYEKSQQVHNFTLNIATSYLAARNGISLGASPIAAGEQDSGNSGQVLRPAPIGPSAENAAGIVAYPTLEKLFDSMDFCACDHCRSVLSPAAYLVDLLQFIDRKPTAAEASGGQRNPQEVLLERRPDLQHLPLTCENTNTALPYIDVVNETLEYYVANDVQHPSLEDYEGHDTRGVASEDLLASPQFVMDAAYTVLRGERFPLPLPFHEPLETLRRIFDKFEVPLSLAMERLRKSDALEHGANAYGWRDILMEDLGLSREEYEILTDSTVVPLARMAGFPDATADSDVIDGLSNAKRFARRVGISYEDLVSLLRTRFINPNSDLIPKLERLGVPFAELQALHDGTIEHLSLPTGPRAPDPAHYGGDIEAWVKDPGNFARIMAIVTLANPATGTDGSDFDALEFRYSKPTAGATDESTRIGAVEFVRLLRFLRLWKKTGWTIEQTDAALCALVRPDLAPLEAEDIDTVAKLDAGFLTLLPRLGIVVRVMKALNLNANRDVASLLACWSSIGTHGEHALYRQMFLNAAILDQDTAFADDGSGVFLRDETRKLLDHAEALRAAFNLTGEEFARIVAALGFDRTTALSVANISAVYRRGWLARKLRLSVRELLFLTSITGLDPFVLPDVTHAGILRLIALVQVMRDRSLKPAAALYLIWNQDLSGKSAPDPARVAEFARTLRGDFASIDDQFAVTEDPGGDVARARMTLVYGQETSDRFFALLENTIDLDVSYHQVAPALDAGILTADPNIAYDHFRHRLSHTGLLNATTRDQLKAVPDVTAAFNAAVDGLFARSEDASGSFFTRHPELKPLYEAYIASAKSPEEKRSAFLAAFRPELARRRKRQQALQRFSDAASVDIGFAQTVLDSEAAPHPLHAAGQAGQPALSDVLALETQGLAARFFFRDSATGAVDRRVPAVANLDYFPKGPNPLPENPAPGTAISGIWEGRVETPEPGFYNIVIEADAGATVSLTFDRKAQPLAQNGTIWRNANPLQLKGGKLYDIALTVAKVKDALSVKWETPKRPREVIPARYLYPRATLAPFTNVYVRFLKLVTLASRLRLTGNEIARFAIDRDYRIRGRAWPNALPVIDDPTPEIAAALLKPFEALLDFARVKADLSPHDEQVLAILQHPATATRFPDSPLFALTHWDPASFTAVLAHFGGGIADLGRLDMFRRVYDAFAVIRRIGVSGDALLRATTNAPLDGGIVRDFQAALRARHAAADWRALVQPINDAMRGLRRDALVAHILHRMPGNPETAQIDTPDKLFEYFLMDVQMEPCMLTSRIRHALSSVQLFIERCLMNLEQPNVSPAFIDAKQWAWMKRYRVWEANRKVFLWPENWLDPALRDDKSPFFKEIESELLQSDITEDSAATAMLNYLAKLEEVARLEPCGMYYVEPAERHGEVIHLVARTAGAHRRHYYRRQEHGSWTPWESIKLDIEDNPVIPVVWKDRLLLFWLRLLRKGPETASRPQGKTPLAELKTDELNLNDPVVTVEALLCWSEYYNGKWQPAKTSDVNRPTTLSASTGAFDRSSLRLGVSIEGDALRVYVSGAPFKFRIRDHTGTSTQLFQMWPGSFRLYNTHSVPVRGDDEVVPVPPAPAPVRRRRLRDDTQNFVLEYSDVTGTPVTRNILIPQIQFEFINPRHELRNTWDAPAFFADSRHVFFVTTQEQPVWIPDHDGYGGVFENSHVLQAAQIPPLVVQPPPPPKSTRRGSVDPVPMQTLVTEDAYIRHALPMTADVAYGGRQIGPAGVIRAAKDEQ